MEKIRTAVRHPLAGKVLTLMAAISGLLLIPAGFFGFFTLTLNVLYFIVCLYILLAGVALVVALIPIAPVRAIVLVPMPFLATLAGRGAYLLLFGSLCVGIGWIGFIIGLVVVAVGVINLLLGLLLYQHIDMSSADLPWPAQKSTTVAVEYEMSHDVEAGTYPKGQPYSPPEVPMPPSK